jgi:hypothetical protein
LAEVERKIAEGRKLWEGQAHMQALYDAQKKGLERAKADAGKAVRLVRNPVKGATRSGNKKPLSHSANSFSQTML